MPLLELHNVTKSYGKARGIIDVSLSVEPGEILGFIGPNGAGKSTTIRCIMNLLNKNSGQIQFEGKQLLQNSKTAYSQIGYMPSEIHLYGAMTGDQMLRYNNSFYAAPCLDKAYQLADQLQYDCSKKLQALSLGNTKKLGFILALMHSPKLAILDEPTSGLDPLVQEEVYAIIRQEQKLGTSFLFSSHNLSEVRKLCSTVAIIREGKIIQCAPIEKLLAHTAVKVRLETSDTVDPSLGFMQDRDGYSMLYSGDLNQLLGHLSRYKLSRLTIEEPDLEEVFLQFYTQT